MAASRVNPQGSSAARFVIALVVMLALSSGPPFAKAGPSKATTADSLSFLSDLNISKTYYERRGADHAEVPFELIDNRPVFRVRLNQSDKVFNFVLDTGSAMTVISTRTASRLNLMGRTSSGRAFGVGGDFKIVYGMLSSCEIGKVRLDNVPVFIRPLANERVPIDGYIGLAFISRFITTVDYGERILSLEANPKRRSINESGPRIPIRATAGGILTNAVSIPGLDSPVSFIVDTGATISALAKSAEKLAGMEAGKQGASIQVVGAAGIERDVKTIVLRRLMVGSTERQEVQAALIDLEQISDFLKSRQLGIVGGNYLRNFRVTLDLPNSTVSLIPLLEETAAVSRLSTKP